MLVFKDICVSQCPNIVKILQNIVDSSTLAIISRSARHRFNTTKLVEFFKLENLRIM